MGKNRLWFKAKRFGWGWYPSSWQGWVVTILFVVYETTLTALIGKSFGDRPGVTSFLLLTAIGVAALMSVCYQFGEVPHWSWGSKKK